MSFYGLGSSGCTIAARLLGSPDWYLLTNEPRHDMARLWILDLPDGELYGAAWIPKLNGPLGHFPYGYDVEPDAPL